MTNKKNKKMFLNVYNYLLKLNNINDMKIFKNKFLQNVKKFDKIEKNVIINLYNDKITAIKKAELYNSKNYEKFLKNTDKI